MIKLDKEIPQRRIERTDDASLGFAEQSDLELKLTGET